MCLLKAIESLINTVTFDFYLTRSLKVSDPRVGLAAQWYLKNLFFFFPQSFPSTLLRMLNVTIRLITTYLLIALWLYLFESFQSRKIENRGKKRPSFLLEVKSFPEILNILLLISQRSEIDHRLPSETITGKEKMILPCWLRLHDSSTETRNLNDNRDLLSRGNGK